MRVDLRPALVALVLAGAGCAHSLPPPGPAPLPVVRQPIEMGTSGAVFARAAVVLRRRGYEIVTCDPALGFLRTSRGEADVPCWGMTCLARQWVAVKLGVHSVRIAVVREVFDSALRSWVRAVEPVAEAAVALEETELMQALLEADLEGGQRPSEEIVATLCGESPACDLGQCSTRTDRIVAEPALGGAPVAARAGGD
jgi:hypothetical protein